jgi:glycine oxidase
MAGQSNRFPTKSKVVIVGGGVIGLSIARALALRDAGLVTVIEKGEFGREASWAAGGILAPQVEADSSDDFLKLACASRDLYPEFASALLKETGIDIELDTTVTLYVAFSNEEEAEFRRRYEWQRTEGLEIEWLTGHEARAIEPCISERVRCALRFPNDFQVENRRLVEALLISNGRLGVQLIGDREVRAVRVANDKVCGVEIGNEFLSAESVVVAAGAWSSSIDPSAIVQVEPVRGQMLCFRAEAGFARHVIYSSRGYLIPRRDGRLIAGSTSEHAGFDKSLTDAGVASIKTTAFEIAPGVASLPLVDSWSGLRPRSRDDLPILGFTPEIEGLCYATGHYRNGILLAPITGELIADAVVSHTVSPLLSPFLPRRLRALSHPG